MEKFYAIIVGAIIVESLIEILKGFINDDKTPNLKLIGGAILGVVLAINCDFDILGILGLNNAIPYFGIVCTGILMSRGSNVVHDLIVKLMNVDKTDEDTADEDETEE
jgi:hypothetical protein